MPLDATHATVLDRLGLIPVPDSVLTAHKVEVEAEFRRQNAGSPYVLKNARWYEFFPLCSNLLVAYGGTNRVVAADRDPLAHLQQRLRDFALGADVIPAAVTAIVRKAERRAREAGIETERVVGFFYTDPYVCLAYSEHGQMKLACLAIWDNGTVLHLAHLT